MKDLFVCRWTRLFAVLSVFFTLCSVSSAQISGAGIQYFQPGFAHRHLYNPALTPQMGYVSFPLLGRLNVSAGSNLGLSNLFFPTESGTLVNFMNDAVSSEEFLSGLKDKNFLNLNLSEELVSAGWFYGRSFWNFGIRLKASAQFTMPKELFALLKNGMYQDPSTYSVEGIDLAVKSYIEASLGYAREIGSDITVGANLKFLVGVAEAELRVNRLDAYMGSEEWRFATDANMRVFGRLLNLHVGENGMPSGFGIGKITPSGYGFGVDLGAEYRPSFLPGLRFSAALLDLGMMCYSAGSIQGYTSGGEVVYTGVEVDDMGQMGEETLGGLVDQFMSMFEFKPEEDIVAKSRRLNTVMNLGVEYAIWGNRFSVGLLNSNTFYRSHTESDLTLIANLRPARWFSLSLGYSFFGGRQGLGWALNITPKAGLNIFVASNYTPLVVNPQFIPLKNARANVQFGITIPMGRSRAYREYDDPAAIDAFPYSLKGGSNKAEEDEYYWDEDYDWGDGDGSSETGSPSETGKQPETENEK